MVLDKALITKLLLHSAQLLKEKSPRLCEIDSLFGDGDHGITINKLAALIELDCGRWGEKSIKQFIDELGVNMMGVNGGSAGPLWGTMISGLAIPVKEETEISPALLKQMLVSSREEMFDITTARVGDKTMMDTLIPAVDAASAAKDDVVDILKAASFAAQEGSKASENFVAKFGRARSYGEKTVGTPDAGAVSLAAFFEGLAQAIAL